MSERAHSRHVKTIAGLESSEDQYRHAVDTLEETRTAWQTETETCLDMFQDMVTARLRMLRDSVWTCSNISSACCVADDGVLEDTRLCLETSYSDIDSVVHSWIDKNQTGSGNFHQDDRCMYLFTRTMGPILPKSQL